MEATNKPNLSVMHLGLLGLFSVGLGGFCICASMYRIVPVSAISVAPATGLQALPKMDPPGAVGIQHAFYLNLDRRTDRRSSIEATMKGTGIALHRLSAVDGLSDPDVIGLCPHVERRRLAVKYGTCRGRTACKLSHLMALELAIHMGFAHVAIFEDDFVFQDAVNRSTIQTMVDQTMRHWPNWDVIVLAAKVVRADTESKRVLPFEGVLAGSTVQMSRMFKAYMTTAYIVSRKHLPILANTFNQCETHRGDAIDECWHRLPPQHEWYAPVPPGNGLGYQIPSFSDLRNVHIDYGDSRGLAASSNTTRNV